MSYRLLCCAAVLMSGWWTGSALAENRIALVIGNSAYQTVTALPNPANDAKAMTDLLTSAGFEVVSAPDLTQSDMRRSIGEFASKAAALGRDTVTLVFYAGHGLQVDGENFLVPVDARIGRESDVALQAMRLTDVMNTLSSVPSKTRIVILDACRNNPFSEINKTGGRGLAIVDAPAGSLVSYSTAPGTEALDGDGTNSPFTSALISVAKEPGVPIEQALKRVRYLVHSATNNQQTPWESSSLIGDFSFFPGQGQATPATPVTPASTGRPAGQAAGGAKAARSVESWRQELRSRSPRDAYEVVIGEDTVEAYQAYLVLFGAQSTAPRVRGLLERRQLMVAWYNAVTINTVASFEAFLASYASSDYAATAQRLLQRARSRSLAGLGPVGPTCACPVLTPTPTRPKKAKATTKEKRASRPVKEKSTKRTKRFISDDEVDDGPPPRAVGGGGPPVSIGIGIGIPIGRSPRGSIGRHPSGGSIGRYPSGGSIGRQPSAPITPSRGHRF
jgi:uncharacterized caspase-like protein